MASVAVSHHTGMPPQSQPVNIGNTTSLPHTKLGQGQDGFMVSFEVDDGDEDMPSGQRLSESFGGMSFTDSLRMSDSMRVSDSQFDADFFSDDVPTELLPENVSGRDSFTRDSTQNIAHPRASHSEYAAHLRQQHLQMQQQEQQLWMQQQHLQMQHSMQVRQHQHAQMASNVHRRSQEMAARNAGTNMLPAASGLHVAITASSQNDIEMSFDELAAHVDKSAGFPSWNAAGRSSAPAPTTTPTPLLVPPVVHRQQQQQQQQQEQQQQQQQQLKSKSHVSFPSPTNNNTTNTTTTTTTRLPSSLPAAPAAPAAPAVTTATTTTTFSLPSKSNRTTDKLEKLKKQTKQSRKQVGGTRAESPAPLKKAKVQSLKTKDLGTLYSNSTPTTPAGKKSNGAKNEARGFWSACCGWGGRKVEKSNIKRVPSVQQVNALTAGLRHDFKEGKKDKQTTHKPHTHQPPMV